MDETGYLIDVIVILCAAVVLVPLFQRVKLGPVLGYLAAGVVIGPFGLELIADGEVIRAFANLGVVFLLFSVGLELPIDRLKVLGGPIIGLGMAQIVVTGLAITGAFWFVTGNLGTAVIAGGALALSSTAIVLRLLSDRREITNRFGRSVVAVLLIQDLAFGPMLVLVTALGQDAASSAGMIGFAFVKAILALVTIFIFGRLILRPLFRPVASRGNTEIVSALTILTVLCTGLLAQWAGLSMPFGAFLAGMLLAETTYRHQVAADILPFRSLLLGLFFMTVGMSINLPFAIEFFYVVIAVAVCLIFGKAILMAVLCRLTGYSTGQSVRFGALLSQGGEFGFVLLSAGILQGIVPESQGQLLIAGIVMTMIATPILAHLGRRIGRRIDGRSTPTAEDVAKDHFEVTGHVIIAGFGRVGAEVANYLHSQEVPFVAVDFDPARVAEARGRDQPVFYGDATRPDILDAVGVETARAVIIALDEPHDSVQLATLLRYIFPRLKILARARDHAHVKELEDAGADLVIPEFVDMGRRLAANLGERDDLAKNLR